MKAQEHTHFGLKGKRGNIVGAQVAFCRRVAKSLLFDVHGRVLLLEVIRRIRPYLFFVEYLRPPFLTQDDPISPFPQVRIRA